MHNAPKLLTILVLWSSVAYMVLFIDPMLLKDVGLPGFYLPFVGMITLASWYTMAVFAKRGWGAMVVAIVILAVLLLSIMKLMYPLLAIALIAVAGFVMYLTFIR